MYLATTAVLGPIPGGGTHKNQKRIVYALRNGQSIKDP